jgi:hypothetical protein
MVLRGYGDMIVTINNIPYQVGDQPETCPRADMTLVWTPGMVVTINGQDYRAPTEPTQPPPLSEYAPNHSDVFATMFGGAADNEHSAYPPYDSSGQGEYLDDEELYVSLPTAIDDAEVRERGVEVFYRATNRKFVAAIRDKGPWVVNDDAYVFGVARPIAETSYNEDKPLPAGSGNNAGKVPANPAGIDLSPALFDALGMDDNGPVSWKWVEPEVA